jgi:hypothetical protein
MTERLTQDEIGLVDDYVSVLDFVSRCAHAIDGGNTYYLWEKASQLERAAGRLEKLLGASSGRPRVRPDAVLAAVRHAGRHYRAGRLLHPEERVHGA